MWSTRTLTCTSELPHIISTLLNTQGDPHCRTPEFSLYQLSLLSGTLSCDSGHPGLPYSQLHLLSSETSLRLRLDSLSVCHSLEAFTALSWNSYRAPLLCFPSPGTSDPYCLTASVLNTLASYISSSLGIVSRVFVIYLG